jgi:hypothetical protein
MTTHTSQALWSALLFAIAGPALPHGCDPLDKYLVGHYHGECDAETELAQGHGEAKGADTYLGQFVKGMPEGKGIYTWENGARLEGFFKNGKAHGAGVYTSPHGVSYDGQFSNGKLEGLKASDCPSTPGPLGC